MAYQENIGEGGDPITIKIASMTTLKGDKQKRLNQKTDNSRRPSKHVHELNIILTTEPNISDLGKET